MKPIVKDMYRFATVNHSMKMKRSVDQNLESMKQIVKDMNRFATVNHSMKMKRSVDQNLESMKQKSKKKVNRLATEHSSMVDRLTLLQQICITNQTEEHLKNIFQYELAPHPMSLFTEDGIRKGTKSTLYDAAFTPLHQGQVNLGRRRSSVIDGGHLLHKVVWSRSTRLDTFQTVCRMYVTYVKRRFGSSVTVVFDGYPTDVSYQSTKSAERSRRALLHASSPFVFSSTTPVTVTQDSFLSNDINKANLINMLTIEMSANNIEVRQATEDADVMIVQTAIAKAPDYDSVIITGDDVDILVLLTALASSPNSNIYFQKSGKGNGPSLLYSAASCKIDPKDILFLHAMSGCDTTSTPFGQGKKKILKFYEKTPASHALAAVFREPNATNDQIAEAGEKFLIQLYGGEHGTPSLDSLRYQLFIKSVVKPSQFQLSRLPPTTDAAINHAHRVYLQMQTWLGNALVPTAWGWTLTRTGIAPITTNRSAAPDSILKMISCSRKYSGSTIPKKGKSNNDIKNRLLKGKRAFYYKRQLLCSTSINLETRKNLLKTYVWRIALYGCETWTISKIEEARIRAFEMWCYRAMLKIKWQDKITNEEVLRRIGSRRIIMKIIVAYLTLPKGNFLFPIFHGCLK
uniref:Uncharacterized protein n=1 Tax=Cacopsylla melanoneura TaxID=428564 RepID=A0A8D8YJ99_9HEMI